MFKLLFSEFLILFYHGVERFARDISEVTEYMVKDELEAFPKPVAYMQKEDKLAFVRSLEEKGIANGKRRADLT